VTLPPGRKMAAATTLAVAAPVTSQVAGSPRGTQPRRRHDGGFAVELLTPLINFDQLTVPRKTG